MEDGTNLYEDNAYITYFDALYLLNIVFKNDSKYAFIDSSHVDGIWSNEKDKYHKFCKIKSLNMNLVVTLYTLMMNTRERLKN